MRPAPRFTILMPTHNRADVIGFAIRSVLAQTEPDFELLVVGDGCTDKTAAVVAGFDDSRIRWFDLPKATHFGYANRNVALREARGSLVAFAAHDDLLLPDHLELLARPFDDDAIDWAYSRPVWVSDDGLAVPFAVDLRKPAELDHFLTKGNTIPASCVVYRRSCLERFGYWPEDGASAGDWAYWKSIVGPSAGANLAYVADATCLHFRASWRTHTAWGPPPLDAWLRAAAGREWWPAALQLGVPAGEAPQSVAWRSIEADPHGWPGALRAGIAEAMDGLAWTAATAVPRMAPELSPFVEQLTHAGVLAAQGRTQEAESELREALQLDPGLSAADPAPAAGSAIPAPGQGGDTPEAIDEPGPMLQVGADTARSSPTQRALAENSAGLTRMGVLVPDTELRTALRIAWTVMVNVFIARWPRASLYVLRRLRTVDRWFDHKHITRRSS